MKGNIEIPEGFIFEVAEGEDIEGNAQLTTALGISEKRANELVLIVRDAFNNATKRRGKNENKQTNTLPALIEVAKHCKTPVELALTSYAFGCYLTRVTGNGGGMRVLHIQIGGPGGNKMKEEGEDDSVEALIRRSYKINGGKREEGEYEE